MPYPETTTEDLRQAVQLLRVALGNALQVIEHLREAGLKHNEALISMERRIQELERKNN